MKTASSMFMAFALSLNASTVLAEAAPHFLLLHNKNERSKLTVQCDPPSNGRLQCKFREGFVFLKTNPEDIESTVEKAMAEFYQHSLAEFSDIGCSMKSLNDQLNAMSLEVSESTLEDMQRKIDISVDLCDHPTAEGVERLLRHIVDMEARTCVFDTRRWTQEFQRLDDNVWTALPPEVLDNWCGIIPLDRIEPTGGSSWRFVKRSVASNPSHTTFTGQVCSDVYNGQETVYEYKDTLMPLQCDYVEIGTVY